MLGFWWVLLFVSILWLLVGVTILFLAKANVAGIITFLFVSLIMLVLSIVLRFVLRAKLGGKKNLEKQQTSISRDEQELFEDAKNYLWEQEGVVVATVFSRGINMIRTEEGQTIPVYGLHFRDRDTNRKYLYGSLVEASSVRKYQAIDKTLGQQEINDFLNTLAKGVREVIKRRITRTDELGRPVYTEETSEPIITETRREQKEEASL